MGDCDQKEDLLHKLVAMATYLVKERYYSVEPVAPMLVSNVLDVSDDDDDNLEDIDSDTV